MSGEARTMVCGDIVSHSKTGDPVMNEGSSTSFCGRVRKWDGFRPSGEAVDDREEVLHAFGLIKSTH